MEKKILALEDSISCQKIIIESLKSSGHIDVVSTCEQARQYLQSKPVDLLLLDHNLPDGNGINFYNEIITTLNKPSLPVIFVTGEEDITKKVTAFAFGAYDYIVKPYAPMELKSRVERIFRQLDNQNIYDNEELGVKMDLLQYRVFVGSESHPEEIELTAQEFKLLHLFVKNKERVFSRQQIINQIWGYDINITHRTVDTHVSTLRKKIQSLPLKIISIRGEGYKSKKVA